MAGSLSLFPRKFFGSLWPSFGPSISRVACLPYIHTGFIAVYLVQPPHLGLSAFAIKEDLSYRDSIF